MLGHRTLNVEDYLTILKRRWWIILIPAIILPAIAVGATYFMTPQYVSSSLVLIDQQKVPSDYVKALQSEPLDSRLAYMTEKILSRSSIEPIINHYNLYGDQHLSMDARVDLTRKALHIDAVQSEIARSNGLPGFTITFTASDPHTAQQVCAEITSLFTTENVKSRQAAAEDATEFLQEQLDDAQRTLNDQDAKIAAFQQQYSGMLPGDETNNEGILSSLSSRLDATTQAIQSLQQNKSVGEALLAQQVQSPPTAAAATQVKVENSEQTELAALEAQEADLSAHYTPDYPDVKTIDRKIADLKAEMARENSTPAPAASPAPVNRPDSAAVVQLRAQLRGIDVQLQAKQKEQDDLKRQIQGYEGKIQASPQVAEQYKEITRDSQTDQALYNSLRDKMNSSQATTDLEHRLEGETFTLLDEANLPTDATFPKISSFAAGGVVAGIVVGLLIIGLLEYKDTALRTEREIWDFTHLPTLAVIAWSGDTAEINKSSGGILRRLFSRKSSKDVLAGAQG